MEVDQDEEGCDKDDNKERYEETKGDVAGEVISIIRSEVGSLFV